MLELEEQIAAVVPMSAAGAVVQLRVLRARQIGSDFREFCENLSDTLIAGLEQLND